MMMVAMVNANDSDARVLVVWLLRLRLRLLMLLVVDGSPVVDVEIPSWCVRYVYGMRVIVFSSNTKVYIVINIHTTHTKTSVVESKSCAAVLDTSCLVQG